MPRTKLQDHYQPRTPAQQADMAVRQFNRRLKSRMAYEDMTQSKLGEAVGLKACEISKRMSGSCRWTLNELFAVCAALNVDARELVSNVSDAH